MPRPCGASPARGFGSTKVRAENHFVPIAATTRLARIANVHPTSGPRAFARPATPRHAAGNARNNYERYIAMAREAASRGDIVEAENFYQHAEHYFRVMREQGS
jgi:Domain of unknown function (DUF4167)